MNERTKRSIILAIGIAFIAITLCFIWSNSLEPRSVSTEKSESIKDTVQNAIGGNNSTVSTKNQQPGFTIDLIFFRKLAHFVEFFILGTECTILILLLKKSKLQWWFNIFAFGVMVAVIDESLQILSKRTSAVKDVLLDVGGFSTGMAVLGAVGAIVVLTIHLIKRKKLQKNSI